MPYSEIVLSKDEADLHHEIDIAASMPFSIASQEGFYSLRAPDFSRTCFEINLEKFS